jgi:hypothetical protein
MTKQVGVSPATVQRIWSGRGLKPHLVKTFKLSNDPLFEEKLIDVVGLYLNPPEQAVVLCMDEKTSIQALDHTQASLPMTKGRAGTVTSDYKRHGTTTLFAALNALDGTVIGSCMDQHRQEEFRKFTMTATRGQDVGLVPLAIGRPDDAVHVRANWSLVTPRPVCLDVCPVGIFHPSCCQPPGRVPLVPALLPSTPVVPPVTPPVIRPIRPVMVLFGMGVLGLARTTRWPAVRPWVTCV